MCHILVLWICLLLLLLLLLSHHQDGSFGVPFMPQVSLICILSALAAAAAVLQSHRQDATF
jgi:hypothetical protein